MSARNVMLAAAVAAAPVTCAQMYNQDVNSALQASCPYVQALSTNRVKLSNFEMSAEQTLLTACNNPPTNATAAAADVISAIAIMQPYFNK